MAQLQSSDEAADWVHKNMPVENELTAADADLVASGLPRPARGHRGRNVRARKRTAPGGGQRRNRAKRTAPRFWRSAFSRSIGKARAGVDGPARSPGGARAGRRRARPFVCATKSIASMWRRSPASSAAGRRGKRTIFALPNLVRSSRKVSDEYTVPVCRLHHRELHRYGDEASCWAGVGVDPLPIATPTLAENSFAARAFSSVSIASRAMRLSKSRL